MSAIDSCAACGREHRPSGSVVCRDHRGDSRTYALCPRCGLMTMSPFPRPEEIAGFYGEDAYYGLGEAKFPKWLEWTRERAAERAAGEVYAAVRGAGIRVLDVGCGNGAFLRHVARHGAEIYGTELKGPAYDRANRVKGIHLTEGTPTADTFPSDHFDAVTLWHVLEHLPDPTAVLRAVRGFLKPAGRLFIEVPNLSSAQARVFGKHWLHLDPPRHLYQYTPGSLERLLARNGFAVIRQKRYSLSMGGVGYLQSMLNVLIPSRDLFYNLLLTRGKASAGLVEKGAAYVLGVALAPLALILTLLEGIVGKGAVIRVTCRKESG